MLTLSIISGSLKGRNFSFPNDTCRIGRDLAGDLVFDQARDPAVSFNHAIIERKGSVLEITDRGSTNGTFVNGRRIQSVVLKEGDLIQFGTAGPEAKVSFAPTVTGQLSAAGEGRTRVLFVAEPKITLEVIKGARVGQKFKYDSAIIKLGREKDNDLHFGDPPSPVVSRYHAEIKRGEAFYQITDLQSTNGTFVNGNRISRATLKTGDLIVLGDKGPEIRVTIEGFEPPHLPERKKPTAKILTIAAFSVLALGAGYFFLRPHRTSETPSKIGSEKPIVQPEVIFSTIDPNDTLLRVYVESEIKRLFAEFGEADSLIPPSFVDRVISYIDYFKQLDRGRWFNRSVARAQQYLPMVKRIFRQNNMPADFAYLALIESGYNPEALHPRSNALGIWQFVPVAAKEFDLKHVGTPQDERKDPRKSTEAAARYLRKLYSYTGSFMLALACYNAGEGRVLGALAKLTDPIAQRNFWYIARKGILKDETNEYVPRYLAATIMAKDPRRFGL